MISFDKTDDRGIEYKIFFGAGNDIELFLLPNTPITNKFKIIISSIQEMSKVIDGIFDEFICCLLSGYQDFDTDEDRYNFLSEYIEVIAYFADYFVENNSTNYADFSNESEKHNFSVFFDESEIKKIIKLSEALKIYSLISNTEIGLSKGYHKKVYNELVEILNAYDPIIKIHNLLKILSLEYKKKVWYENENIDHWSFVKFTNTFITIQNSGLIVCKYDQNPIPFFIEIFSKSAQWRDPYKEKGIIYYDNDNDNDNDNDDGDDDDDDESQKDKDDNLLTPLRKHINLKRLADKNVLNELHKISFNYLVESYINQRKKIKNHEKIDIGLLKHRINQINYISPLWGIILAPLLSKSIGVKYEYLLKQSPKKVAVISFYLGHQLKSLSNHTILCLFDLSVYYPKSKVPKSTKYRLNNISYFLNSTLKYSMHNIHGFGGSRINLVRLIEDFTGKMKTKTVSYNNILTGKPMGRIDFNQIEEKTIDYLVMYFLNNLKYEARVKTIISKDINVTITQGNLPPK